MHDTRSRRRRQGGRGGIREPNPGPQFDRMLSPSVMKWPYLWLCGERSNSPRAEVAESLRLEVGDEHLRARRMARKLLWKVLCHVKQHITSSDILWGVFHSGVRGGSRQSSQTPSSHKGTGASIPTHSNFVAFAPIMRSLIDTNLNREDIGRIYQAFLNHFCSDKCFIG